MSDTRTEAAAAVVRAPGRPARTGAAAPAGEPADRGGRPTARRLGPGGGLPFGRLIGPALLVAVWWGAAALGLLDPRILSGPADVLGTARDLVAQGRLQSNMLVSKSDRSHVVL
ncbi:hypothetical protein GCM10023082_32480 [Streptomyces tremellae]|uniref:ABC transporter permease n=1 Tax=Streptomyces tremellae TaxID=1124239 RepID=A0ABP7F8K0_9ACTN